MILKFKRNFMAETQAKYHHLVPRTYMSAWAHGNGTLNVEFKNNPGIIATRNKDHIAGITDYHSIKAGMPCCTKSDTDAIFAEALQYTIKYQGKTVTDSLELNRIFYDFDNWEIIRGDGTIVSKKSIKREIEKIKIKDIEANWASKYEDKWTYQLSIIENNILHTSAESIPAFDFDYIMKFYTALDWRGFCSNEQFEKTFDDLCNNILELDDIEIPENERMLPFLKTAADEMHHYLLLSYYRKYLSDSGIIYQNALANMKHTSFHFLIADGPTKFITSDTPVFIHTRSDSKKVGLLPLTPNILMAQGLCTDASNREYCISHITDEAVQRYNSAIKENAEEFIIIA